MDGTDKTPVRECVLQAVPVPVLACQCTVSPIHGCADAYATPQRAIAYSALLLQMNIYSLGLIFKNQEFVS